MENTILTVYKDENGEFNALMTGCAVDVLKALDCATTGAVRFLETCDMSRDNAQKVVGGVVLKALKDHAGRLYTEKGELENGQPETGPATDQAH